MNHTTNYQLNQWSADDRVQRVDFNADNAKIDAAIKAVEQRVTDLVFGSYTGDGAASRTISLGRTPKAVILFQQNGGTSYNFNLVELCGGLILSNSPLSYNGHVAAAIVEGGFSVSYYSGRAEAGNPVARTNREGTVYHYLAFH